VTPKLKGVIGIDPGVRRLLTCTLVNDLGAPAMSWHYDGGPAMLTLIKYVGGDESVSGRQALAAKGEIRATLHRAAKEIVHRAATYHCGIAIEELAEGEETSGMTRVLAFEKVREMAAPQAAFFLAPFDFFHADLATLCRAANVPEPVIIEAPTTSTTCPVCWEVNRYSRSGDSFRCSNCTYEAQADENAAHVIGMLAWAVLSKRATASTSEPLLAGAASEGDLPEVPAGL
jgi:transposase